MSNYTKTTNFATKDSLPSGDPNKIVKGAEINTEFDNIATAVSTKSNSESPTFTGTVTIPIADINGGAIDGTVIGGTTAASITGTTLTANTSLNIAGDGATVTGIKDEDDMASNSATKLATQQSIKAYVDSQVTAQDLDVTTDSGTISIDLDSETLTVAGGTGLDSSATGNTVTLGIDSTVATLTGTQTLTNKTLTAPIISGNLTTDGTIDGRDVATDGNKLDNIEANADVTDTANVTAAGALMDSEVTNLAQVKAFDSADYATAAQGSTADSALQNVVEDTTPQLGGNLDLNSNNITGTGNIDVTGTVSADGLAVTSGYSSDNIMQVFGGGTIYAGLGVDGTGAILTAGSSGSADSDLIIKTSSSGTEKQRARFQDNGDISFYEDTGTTAKLFWDASAESLGIGTSSPSDLLNISGSSNQIGLDTGDQATYGTLDIGHFINGAFIGTQAGSNAASNILRLGTSGIERMRIDSSGNVGIGTSSPNSTAGFTTVTLNNATSGGIIDFENNTSLVGRIYNTSTNFHVYNQTANSLLFGTGGTEKMRIDSSGRVGIGTSSPDTHLEISVGSTADGLLLSSTNADTSGRLFLQNATAGEGYAILQENGGLDFRSGATAGTSSGTQRVRIDASGNVGIGTSSPAESIHTTGNIRLGDSAPAELYSNSSELRFGVDRNNDNGTSNITFYVDNSEKMRIDSSGRVGIGTSSPSGLAHIYSSSSGATAGAGGDELILESSSTTGLSILSGASNDGNILFGDSGNSAIGYIQYKHANNALAFGSNGTERMRIDSSGNLLVGTTSPISSSANTANGFTFSPSGGYAWLSVSDTGGIFVQRQNDNNVFSFYRATANVGSISVTSSATSYNTSSDQRLKDNIVDAPSASDDIDAIQVRSFDWKADGSHQKYGMVAQELQTVAPEAVSGDADSEEMMGVDYSKLVPMLIKEIQTLRNRVAQLENN